MSDAISIRPGRLEDAAVIADFNIRVARETEGVTLNASVVLSGVSAALTDERRGRYFVAESAGEIIGQLLVTREWSDWRDGEIWWIASVYVATEFRGQGIFASLYRHVEALAREQNAIGVRLYVEKDNQTACEVYARLGMQMTHYRVMERMF